MSDPAFNTMVLNMLRNVLSHASSPGDLGDYLTEEILNLTGARCILFIQSLQTETEIAHRVVSVRPVRLYRWAESEEMKRLYKIACAQENLQVWRAENSSESVGFLLDQGYHLSATFPLLIGELRVGAMLLLGLPDTTKIAPLLDLFNSLSSIVALVLRNSFLYEKQEQIIHERTGELRRANERLQAELLERLRVEAHLSEAQKIAQMGSWTHDLVTGELIYSDGTRRIFGWQEGDLPTEDNYMRYIYPEDLPRVQALLARARRGQETTLSEEYRIVRSDGEVRHLFIRFFVVSNNEGCPVRWEGIVQDVTERKRAEEALRKSEERFRLIAENAHDLIYRMSLPEGCYEYISPAVERITGYTPEECYRNPKLVQAIIHPDWLEYFAQEWEKLLQGKGTPSYEYQIFHRNGEVRWLYQRNVLISDTEGRPVAIEGIVGDITDRKRKEADLETRIRLLEAELAQRR